MKKGVKKLKKLTTEEAVWLVQVAEFADFSITKDVKLYGSDVAIKFKNVPIEKLVKFCVNLKADEFHGTHKGYFLFWFD